MRRRFFNSRINNNFIIYTSSDNLIVIPFKYDFGATIISNAINNNVGKITFNSDVTIIGNSAFSNCYNLTSIEIPNSVTSIGYDAFNNCESLTSVVIGNSVTSIGNYAFAWCSSLTNIEIPDSVTSIVNEAFYECSRLSSVYVKATTPPILGDYVFDNNASGRKIYVPRASLNAYKTASGWSEYADAIEPYDY